VGLGGDRIQRLNPKIDFKTRFNSSRLKDGSGYPPFAVEIAAQSAAPHFPVRTV